MTRKMAVLAGAVGLALAASGCEGDRPSAPDRADGWPLSEDQLAAALTRAQLPSGRPALTWVPRVHAEAMQRWLRTGHGLSSLPGMGRCGRLEALARATIPEIKRASGVTADGLYQRAFAASHEQVGCRRPARPLSIESPSMGWAHVEWSQEGDTVTGEYEAYAAQIETALANAAAPAQGVAAIDQVLSQASVLAPADFEVLAALASVAASSAWYWYEYQGSTGGNDEPMLVLGQAGDRFSWRDAAMRDFGGAVAVAGFLRLIGARDPRLLIAGALGGAVVGSGAYAYDHM